MPANIITTAARYLASKLGVTTDLSSAEISDYVPQALRDNAVFSARTVYAEHLAETQRDIVTMLDGKTLSPAEIRTRMKLRLDRLGYQPDSDKRGGLQDLSSDMRTNLIISMQESTARGYAVNRSHQDPAILSVWPAQELYRAVNPRGRKRDWRTRWNDARMRLGEGNTSATYAATEDGPFIATVNDPIWPLISRFGTPFAPFDYNSGMRLRLVDRQTAIANGVIRTGETVDPEIDPMRQVQSSSTLGMPDSIVSAWASLFGDRAVVAGGRVSVAPAASVVAEVASAAARGIKSTVAFGFSNKALSGKFLGAGVNVPADAALRISSASIRSGDIDKSILGELNQMLGSLGTAVRKDGELIVVETRRSVATLRYNRADNALDVVSFKLKGA